MIRAGESQLHESVWIRRWKTCYGAVHCRASHVCGQPDTDLMRKMGIVYSMIPPTTRAPITSKYHLLRSSLFVCLKTANAVAKITAAIDITASSQTGPNPLVSQTSFTHGLDGTILSPANHNFSTPTENKIAEPKKAPANRVGSQLATGIPFFESLVMLSICLNSYLLSLWRPTCMWINTGHNKAIPLSLIIGRG